MNEKSGVNALLCPTFNQYKTSVSVNETLLTPLEKTAVALFEGLRLPMKRSKST